MDNLLKSYYSIGEEIRILEDEVIKKIYQDLNENERSIISLSWNLIFAPLFNRVYQISKKYRKVKQMVNEEIFNLIKGNSKELIERSVDRFPLSNDVPRLLQSNYYRNFLRSYQNISNVNPKIEYMIYDEVRTRINEEAINNIMNDNELVNDLTERLTELTMNEYQNIVDNEDLLAVDNVYKINKMTDDIVRIQSAKSRDKNGIPII